MCPPCVFSWCLLQRAVKAQPSQLGQFHTPDYIDFLARVTPDNMTEYTAAMGKHNFNEDCPVFDGLFDYCRWVRHAYVMTVLRISCLEAFSGHQLPVLHASMRSCLSTGRQNSGPSIAGGFQQRCGMGSGGASNCLASQSQP